MKRIQDLLSNSKSKFINALLVYAFIGLLFWAPLVFATTFVVMEGETEVGRYEEADGFDQIQRIQNDKPKAKPIASETEEMEEIPKVSFVPIDKAIEALQRDPEFSAYLNQQLWMFKLRQMDKRYDLKNKLLKHRSSIVIGVWGLASFLILFRIYRIIAWLSRKKRKPESKNQT